MEDGRQKLAPFILKPMRINNYTHLIALLKSKQSKYKDCTHGPVNTAFSKVLGTSKVTLDLDSIHDGFLHEKLRSKAEEFEKKLFSDMTTEIDKKIEEIKAENNQRAYACKIGSTKDVEELFFERPSPASFRDEFLFDIYTFINQKLEPQGFLHSTYLRYILRFMAQHQQSLEHLESEKLDDTVLKNIVKQFVKLRFNSEEYCIEAYESRYLWAEAFILLRIGRQDLVQELLSEYEIFFEFMAKKFKTAFTGYLSGKRPNFVLSHRHEDKFKRFLFELADDKAKSDGLVINTAEDYLWLRILSKKDIKKDIARFESNKLKFMVSLFAKDYSQAIDILLKSDFGIISKFFLLRELCVESNTVNSSWSKSESTTINPVFLNFLFNIVSRLNTKEKKSKLIEMLKSHEEYYDVIPRYIIKFELFDILGSPSEKETMIEYSLDPKVSTKVLQQLREEGERSKIIKLYNIIDDVSMIQVLKETVEEAILIDGAVDQTIVEKYLKSKISKDSDELQCMYGFYKFAKEPTITSLKQTALFEQHLNVKAYKFVIEKIMQKAVEAVKAEGDRVMAKYLFRLCGTLDLSEECVSKASKDLVHLI
ncbi:hypothetical protein GINT2_000600 [Glugoides intestinalis]